jgi:energy-coupling factor transport system substrate-specific component
MSTAASPALTRSGARSLHLALIPLGIGINMAVGTIVLMLKLPIYLDAIGTILVTLLAGLWPGVLTAVLSQILAGYTVNPVLPYFIPTSVAVAVYTHIAVRFGAFRSMRRVVIAGIGLGVVAGIVSAPIIVYVFGGMTTTGRSLITAYLISAGERALKSVILSGAAAEPIDKTLQYILAIWLINGVPASMLRPFRNRGALSACSIRWMAQDAADSPVSRSVHPAARGLAALFGLAGTLMAQDTALLMFAWLGVILPMTVMTGVARPHTKVITGVVVPLGLILIAVWGWLVAAPPGGIPGTDPDGGVAYALHIAVKLAVLVGVFQLCFLSIPPSELLGTFWNWGVRGDYLIVAIGAFTIWPELRLRAEQILTARFARGLMPDRRLVTRLRQAPFILRPLFAWSLRAAIQRSEMWEQRGMLERAGRLRRRYAGAGWRNIALVGLALVWLGLQFVAPETFRRLFD